MTIYIIVLARIEITEYTRWNTQACMHISFQENEDQAGAGAQGAQASLPVCLGLKQQQQPTPSYCDLQSRWRPRGDSMTPPPPPPWCYLGHRPKSLPHSRLRSTFSSAASLWVPSCSGWVNKGHLMQVQMLRQPPTPPYPTLAAPSPCCHPFRKLWNILLCSDEERLCWESTAVGVAVFPPIARQTAQGPSGLESGVRACSRVYHQRVCSWGLVIISAVATALQGKIFHAIHQAPGN